MWSPKLPHAATVLCAVRMEEACCAMCSDDLNGSCLARAVAQPAPGHARHLCTCLLHGKVACLHTQIHTWTMWGCLSSLLR